MAKKTLLYILPRPSHLCTLSALIAELFSVTTKKKLAAKQLLFKWDHGVIQDLVPYAKAYEPGRAQAGPRLAEGVGRALYQVGEAAPDPYTSVPQQWLHQHPRDGIPSGPSGARFRCGLYGHWAHNCTTQPVHHGASVGVVSVIRPDVGAPTGEGGAPRVLGCQLPVGGLLLENLLPICMFLILPAALMPASVAGLAWWGGLDVVYRCHY